MLELIVGLVLFFASLYYFKNKLNFSEEVINGLLAGSCFFSGLSGVTKIVVGIITFNHVAILGGLFIAVLYGFFAYVFAKRGELI